MVPAHHDLLTVLRDHGQKHLFPEVLYRYDKERRFSDCILSGSVWITTLVTCRTAEEKGRADPGDGTLIYRSGRVEGSGHDPYVQAIAPRLKIAISPGSVDHVLITGMTVNQKIRDAWVYCMTVRDAPEAMADFGRFCVRIKDPYEFYLQLYAAFLTQIGDTADEAVGLVDYAEREYSGLEDSPGDLGFVKPPDEYAKQEEYRFIWLPKKPNERIAARMLTDAIDPALVERVR